MNTEDLKQLDEMVAVEKIATPEDVAELITPIEEKPVTVPKKGRHKKMCECEKCMLKYGELETRTKTKSKSVANASVETKTENTQIESKNSFENAINEFKAKQPKQLPLEQGKLLNIEPSSTENESVNTAQISGVMLLTIIDFAAPFLLVKILGFFSPKYKDVDLSKIKLDAIEKKELEEVADVVAREYVNMSPITLLTLGLGSIYFSKIQTYSHSHE